MQPASVTERVCTGSTLAPLAQTNSSTIFRRTSRAFCYKKIGFYLQKTTILQTSHASVTLIRRVNRNCRFISILSDGRLFKSTTRIFSKNSCPSATFQTKCASWVRRYKKAAKNLQKFAKKRASLAIISRNEWFFAHLFPHRPCKCPSPDGPSAKVFLE